MNLTDLRQHPPKQGSKPRSKTRAPEPEPTVSLDGRFLSEQFEAWLDEFARLHHVGVQVLGPEGQVLAGPVREPDFCLEAKRACPDACPSDCGRATSVGSDCVEASVFHCPYHLSNITWQSTPPEGETWTVVLGRTLATQDQMSCCVNVVQETMELNDEALSALGSIPWSSENHLTSVARFLQASLDWMFRVGQGSDSADKDKDLSSPRRNVSQE